MVASGAGFRTFCHSSPQAILVRICLGGDADDLARPFPFILKLGFMFLNDKKSRNNSAEAANNADNSVINKEGWSVSFDRAVGAIAKYWKHNE